MILPSSFLYALACVAAVEDCDIKRILNRHIIGIVGKGCEQITIKGILVDDAYVVGSIRRYI